ncbi:LPXTG cell wall anchor domain-containing protein [Enterococcus sp. 5B3_DIV0040]|uniref:LPXTG cell wall anchor domain-containing protein n=1 Tax=Enterococcus sp. 5B3_DIV0040 TaxID=1834182 RepID=UPI000A358183
MDKQEYQMKVKNGNSSNSSSSRIVNTRKMNQSQKNVKGSFPKTGEKTNVYSVIIGVIILVGVAWMFSYKK